MIVIAFSSVKGGVGKSTDAILLANNLAARGHRVLFIDMDVNNSSTVYYTMGIAEEFPVQNIAEALMHRTTDGYIVKSRIENIDIIPSSLRVFDIRTMDYHVLKNILPQNKYDYVVIDTSPTYDNIVMNALYAADYIFTPVQLDFFNLTTTKFLRTHFYDELPEKVNGNDNHWFIIYSFWKTNLSSFAESAQMQFAGEFEKEFNNILDFEFPDTSATKKYVQTDEKLSVKSRMLSGQRLAVAVNKLACLITGEDGIVERF